MVSIETDRALLQYTAVPAVGIPPVPPNNQFEFEDYDSDDDARCGYGSDNECGPFLGAVMGEDGYDDDKGLPDSMVGECRDGNETTDKEGKLVLLSNSEID